MKDYIEYVQEQINYFRKHSELIDHSANEITPQKINTILANFSNVQLALHSEYRRKHVELKTLKRKFQAWWDEKYVAMRKKLNPITLSGSKWLSKNEIESETRVEHAIDYEEWKEQVDVMEEQVSFIHQLMQDWSSLGYRLSILSDNSRQEMISLGVENKINSIQPHRTHSFSSSDDNNRSQNMREVRKKRRMEEENEEG